MTAIPLNGTVGWRRPGAAVRPRVGVVLDRYSPELHGGIVRAARELDWDLDDSRCRGWAERLPFASGLDGVLATTATLAVSGWVAKLGCPVVRILEDAVACDDGWRSDLLPTVGLGFPEAGRLGARHLVSLGRPHLAYAGRRAAAGGHVLERSFLAECGEMGVEARVLTPPREEAGGKRRHEWLVRALATMPRPCAVMAADDELAVDLIAAARALGLEVPDEVAVLGTKNLELVHGRSPVTVSSIDLNLGEAGYLAAAWLQRLMRGERLAARYGEVAPLGLVPRHSTACGGQSVPGISRALLRVRRDFAQPLTLACLAREAGTSVRTLQRLYRVLTGRTVSEDLLARRMEAAAEMLRTTDLKLDPIAMETGLGNAKNLCRRFRERHGVSPGEWRRQSRTRQREAPATLSHS